MAKKLNLGTAIGQRKAAQRGAGLTPSLMEEFRASLTEDQLEAFDFMDKELEFGKEIYNKTPSKNLEKKEQLSTGKEREQVDLKTGQPSRRIASEKSPVHDRLKADDEGRAPIEKVQQTGLTQDERLLGNLQAEMRQDRADDFDVEDFIKRNEAIENFRQKGSTFLKTRTK